MTSLDFGFANRDHFALFGLPRGFAIDREALEQTYQDVQARVHPDRHAHAGEAQRRIAMQWATQVNEAYQTLKTPLARAQYLLRLGGHDPRTETNTAMPAEFLMEQMELREAVAEARAAQDGDRIEALERDLRQATAQQYEALRQALDEAQNPQRAGEIVRQLMFQEKLLMDIEAALDAATD